MDDPEDPSFTLQVECYSGYRGEETPRKFVLSGKHYQVIEVIDQWLDPEHRYFKVRADDQGVYILRHVVKMERWEFHSFVRPACGER